MSARDRVLDTFEALLINEGERAATLDAVASRASVSKGGLLYHFPSWDALVTGLVQRAETLAAAYLDELRAAPEGPAAAFIRTSAETATVFDRTLLALSKLGTDRQHEARDLLRRAQQDWLELVKTEVRDHAAARAIVLLGDGLYYNALFQGESPDEQQLEDLLRVVSSLRSL